MARRAFIYGAWLVVAAIVVQFLFAGLGVFTNQGFFLHLNVGATIVFFLPLLLVLAGWLGRVPGRLLWLMAAVPGLVILQSLFLFPYHAGAQGILRAISSLHVVNALFMFWVSLQVLERTRALD